tara:strand:- start:35392 stop:35985 length:594 start_codon:yes stop_codon:yes gene_type:complete
MAAEVIAHIASRRSVAKFTEQAVSPQLISEIIEMGTFAPCHKRTDPWRFVIFEGAGRDALACAMMNGYAAAKQGFDGYEENLEKIKRKPYRAPTIIMVWCAAGRAKKNPPVWEDHAAVAACLQNMSLAAHAFGLGSIWRTGGAVDFPQVQDLCKTETDSFDASKGDKIMGMLYVGHMDNNFPKPNRFPEEAQVVCYK